MRLVFKLKTETKKKKKNLLVSYILSRMFEEVHDASRVQQKTEKLKCLLNYFTRVTARRE